MKPLHVLFLLAVGAPLLALIPGQDAAATDWPKEVERACRAQRYGLRLAAGRKVAAGGATAVPAIAAWAQQHGRNELAASLVEAIAEQGTDEEPVVDLLLGWAADRDFFWRAQAMKGLARRGPALPGRRAALAALFAAHHEDPAWLTRVHARLGSELLGGPPAASLPESDPRAATRLCGLLLQHGKAPDLQPLFDALLDERTFPGNPWGPRRASEAFAALKAWLGDAHPLADGQSFADAQQGVAALLAAARSKSGQALTAPAVRRDAGAPAAGAIEVLSCRNGDLFVQWTADGELAFGLDAARRVRLPAAAWQQLSRERAALDLGGGLGVVICDAMRLQWDEPAVHVAVAPAALPAAAAKWLASLAEALAAADEPAARDLRDRLEQFVPR